MCVTVCTSGRRTVSTRTRHQSSAAVICHGFNLLDEKTNCPSCTDRPGRSTVIGSTRKRSKAQPNSFSRVEVVLSWVFAQNTFRLNSYFSSFQIRYSTFFYLTLNIIKRGMFFNLSYFVKFYHVSHKKDVVQYFGSFFANKGIDQRVFHKPFSLIYFGHTFSPFQIRYSPFLFYLKHYKTAHVFTSFFCHI